MKRGWVLVASMVLALGACKKDAPAAAGGGGAPAAPPAFKIEKLGLSIDVKTPAEVSDMLGSQMIQANGYVVTVKEVKADDEMEPKTLEDEVKEADIYTPTIDKKEKTADGWVVQFHNKGDMGESHFVVVRRTIDGKQYKCTTTAPAKEQADLAAAACATLRKS